MKRLPITEKGLLNYENRVLLIKPDNNGNDADFTIDGLNGGQCSIRGFVAKEFPVRYRWFKRTWWYKKTNWFDNKDKIIYFCTGNYIKRINWEAPRSVVDKQFKRLKKEVMPKAKPVDKILEHILKHASIETGIKLKPDFDDSTYGVHWSEAYIPVKDENNEKYLLTWENSN